MDADAPGRAARPPRACRPRTATERAIELLRGAERPVIMAGTGLYWAHGEDALRALAEELADPGVRERPGARLHARRPRAVLLARARHRASRGPTWRWWSACRWTSGWASAARSARTPQIVVDRLGAARPRPTRASRPPSSTAACPPRSTRCARAPPAGPDRSAWVAALREAENEKRAGEQEELTDDRAPLHPLRALPRARPGARPQRGGDRRRRRLRVLRRPGDRDLRAGLLDGPGAVRMPRLGPGLRAGGQARATRTARSACCWATARSASPAWSSTRSCATACRWWR